MLPRSIWHTLKGMLAAVRIETTREEKREGHQIQISLSVL